MIRKNESENRDEFYRNQRDHQGDLRHYLREPTMIATLIIADQKAF